MKRASALSITLLTILAIAVISQLMFEQATQSTFSLAASILLIFVLSYLLARLYHEYETTHA